MLEKVIMGPRSPRRGRDWGNHHKNLDVICAPCRRLIASGLYRFLHYKMHLTYLLRK